MLFKKSAVKVVVSLALGICVFCADLAGAGEAIVNKPGVLKESAYVIDKIDLVGDFVKQDPTKQEYLDLMKIAERLLNQRYPGDKYRLTGLLEVYTQVVAGMNYKLICRYTDLQGTGEKELCLYKDLKGIVSLIYAKNR